ncbi:MAG: Outer rane receptor for ferrienterochelin and colicin [Candidatus Sulfotelmatobacter sp.]|nr:Outer rane receptor for ferrienterochelin and colicin [Candidatus Sulfotelmatobacter sp.]
MRKSTAYVASILLFVFPAFAQSGSTESGSIRGDVFTKGTNGEPAVLPGVRIVLHGPITKETESDAQGAFAIDSLPPGTYEIEANAPGLSGRLAVEVTPGTSSTIPLEMNVTMVSNTVNVTATEAFVADESAQHNTISQSVVEEAPNRDEKIDSLLPLVPGVVRGPDGRINMKGAQSTQAGWLVNSANVTDPATGGQAISLPIDVVSSVQVISNAYDPEYGKFTGAVSSVETRTSNFDKFHFSIQNLAPRARDRDGSIVGIGGFTPRTTITGPLIRERLAFTQSLEYRFVRTPVESLPPLQRDTTLESFDSFSQFDLKISDRQTATLSVAVFPQKFDFLGLNTFNPQPSTTNLHQRGDQISAQHSYVAESGALLSSRVAYEEFDADTFPNSQAPYQIAVETTEGGFFSRQNRDTRRVEWQEIYHFSPKHFLGDHEMKVGFDFSHSSYDGRQQFLPVSIVGTAGSTLEQINFGTPTIFSIQQNEVAWFAGDQWKVGPRLTLDFGLRFDRDSVTNSTHSAPRASLTFALTGDRRTLLKAGAGLFYDRVPLNAPAFPNFPDRTILTFDAAGDSISSVPYSNVISRGLKNPRSETWNVEVDRQVLQNLLVQLAYQQRNTVNDLVVGPETTPEASLLSLASRGRDFYREFQVTGRYQIHRQTLNASYVRSKATGDLNDFNQFFGNDPQPVIQPNSRGPLAFDAPNRFLAWAELNGPWKLMLMPVLDIHTGFPYSVVNERRDFVGPRNDKRFPQFDSFDLQVLRTFGLPFHGKEHKVKLGFGVFNLFNHANYRDVQNDLDSDRFGQFFNSAVRTFRGKLVFGF